MTSRQYFCIAGYPEELPLRSVGDEIVSLDRSAARRTPRATVVFQYAVLVRTLATDVTGVVDDHVRLVTKRNTCCEVRRCGSDHDVNDPRCCQTGWTWQRHQVVLVTSDHRFITVRVVGRT